MHPEKKLYVKTKYALTITVVINPVKYNLCLLKLATLFIKKTIFYFRLSPVLTAGYPVMNKVIILAFREVTLNAKYTLFRNFKKMDFYMLFTQTYFFLLFQFCFVCSIPGVSKLRLVSHGLQTTVLYCLCEDYT